ncbi:amidase domain-containing protein [Gordonia sp. NPDC003424]
MFMRRLAAAFGAAIFILATFGAPAEASPASITGTQRGVIAAYALYNWDPDETSYKFSNDCTYFVSSALWMVLSETPEWTSSSSDERLLASSLMNPGPTKAAAAADYFAKYMVASGTATSSRITWSDNTAHGAQLGDVIAYDWDGKADGSIDHLAIVTGFASDGYPLVTQHSPSRRNRGWSWDPSGNNWIEFTHPGSAAFLIHIK